MPTNKHDGLEWFTSSAGDQCVEMALDGDTIHVGNSRFPDGPTVPFTIGEVFELLRAAKAGEYDHLVAGYIPE